MPDEGSSAGGGSRNNDGDSGGGNFDFLNDEIKVYKYEGDQDQPASEILSEDKIVLVTDAENIKNSEDDSLSPDSKNHLNGLMDNPFSRRFSSLHHFITPYPYSTPLGLGPVPVHHPGFPFYNDFFAQPPPAHMGFSSWPLATPPGFCPPTPMYGLPPGQTPPFYGLPTAPQAPSIYPALSPSQLAPSFYPTGFSPVPTWPHGAGYPFSCYPQLSKLQPASMLGSHLGFSYPGISHPALVSNLNQSHESEMPAAFRTSGNSLNKRADSSKTVSTNNANNNNNSNVPSHSSFKPFSFEHRLHSNHAHHLQIPRTPQHARCPDFSPSPNPYAHGTGSRSRSPLLTSSSSSSSSSKIPHIKKPLNAFMLFMKEMRQKVIDECTLKESAAINQILGKKWHSLDRTEQTKYYDMARREKELHRQLYPSWTARDNYAIHARKKKRREMMRDDDRGIDGVGDDKNGIDCMNAKKCRARYGVEQQHKWCKPCRRKKRCIRFMHDNSDPLDENEDETSSTSTSHQNINNNRNNNNASVADSTTEVFSPISSTNTDDSRNRCCHVAQMTDESGVSQSMSNNTSVSAGNSKQAPLTGMLYPSSSHSQSVRNGLQLNFTKPSAINKVSQTDQNMAGGVALSVNQVFASRSSSNQTPMVKMTPTFASPASQNQRNSQSCYTACQQQQQQSSVHHPSLTNDGQSRLNLSFSDMSSQNMIDFSTNAKLAIGDSHQAKQATTIF